METTPKVSMKKKKTRFFEIYISKLLRTISETNGITSNSKQQLNSIICQIAQLFTSKCLELTEIASRKTISEKQVKNAALFILPKELSSKALIQCEKAIKTYENESVVKGLSRQQKAGLVFPPSIVEKHLRGFRSSKIMINARAPIFLAAILQYLTGEILENASQSAKDKKRVRITIRDLELGIRSDLELDKFFSYNKFLFLGGGVVPYIHPNLTSKKCRKRKTDIKTDIKTDNTEIGRKKHRFRPGTVSLRDIRRLQKTSNCVILARFPFEKLVRKKVEENVNNTEKGVIKISKDVFLILQYFIEGQMLQLFQNANFAAIYSNRVKLIPNDLFFILNIQKGLTKSLYNEENTNAFEVDIMQRNKVTIDNNDLASEDSDHEECGEECDEECGEECDEECGEECDEECGEECGEECDEECDEKCDEECKKE